MIFILYGAFVMRIVSRFRSILIGLCACMMLFFLTASAANDASTELIVSKVDSYYQAITKRINKTKLTSLRKRLRTRTEKSYTTFLATLPEGDQKLIVQVLLTKIQQRTQQEIIPTQDLVLIRQVINATNSERETHGLSPLTLSHKLTMAAYRHAYDLRDHFPYDADGDGAKEQISHTGSDGSTAKERVEAVGYDRMSIAENIAYNQITVEEVLHDWMESPHHQANILSDTVTEIGIAKVGPYWVQVFGKERVNK